MEIKLCVSKEKNLERLNKLSEDPAFIVSILKTMGLKTLPDNLSFKLGILKPKNDKEKMKKDD